MTLQQYKDSISIVPAGAGRWSIYKNGIRVNITNDSQAIDRIKNDFLTHRQQGNYDMTLLQAYKAIASK